MCHMPSCPPANNDDRSLSWTIHCCRPICRRPRRYPLPLQAITFFPAFSWPGCRWYNDWSTFHPLPVPSGEPFRKVWSLSSIFPSCIAAGKPASSSRMKTVFLNHTTPSSRDKGGCVSISRAGASPAICRDHSPPISAAALSATSGMYCCSWRRYSSSFCFLAAASCSMLRSGIACINVL